MIKERWGISQEGLKLIACVTMLIDHFGYVIVPHLQIPGMRILYYACRMVGRLAFPIYCFLLVEGMKKTRNPQKYLLRLAIGILLAELPVDFLFRGGISWKYQSVMVTLTLGAMMLWCMEKTQQEWAKPLVIFLFAVLAELAKSSYGSFGILMIAVFALFDQVLLQTLGIFLINAFMDSVTISAFGIPLPIQPLATLAVIPIALYNGRKLTQSKVIQWGFYLFYPVHLLALWLIRGFVR